MKEELKREHQLIIECEYSWARISPASVVNRDIKYDIEELVRWFQELKIKISCMDILHLIELTKYEVK